MSRTDITTGSLVSLDHETETQTLPRMPSRTRRGRCRASKASYQSMRETKKGAPLLSATHPLKKMIHPRSITTTITTLSGPLDCACASMVRWSVHSQVVCAYYSQVLHCSAICPPVPLPTFPYPSSLPWHLPKPKVAEDDFARKHANTKLLPVQINYPFSKIFRKHTLK